MVCILIGFNIYFQKKPRFLDFYSEKVNHIKMYYVYYGSRDQVIRENILQFISLCKKSKFVP